MALGAVRTCNSITSSDVTVTGSRIQQDIQISLIFHLRTIHTLYINAITFCSFDLEGKLVATFRVAEHPTYDVHRVDKVDEFQLIASVAHSSLIWV